ncbi:hypothetical protein SAMN05216251_1278 [Actinacidiphila alni]|uniref:Uncharacterized protein n=1 Tax=Actinacidiphila alni TaxID=380248 RepID=A0A1I2L5D4_9ACTN|nr:hypothetical protein [Actinacidiphila alni]SFF74552.1 hypothetical protein SAMN05216251_1278 [Actinacidiphila alni]
MFDETAVTEKAPTTLAGRVSQLRDLITPRGEPPLSYEKLAREIEDRTGLKVTGAHLHNIASGAQPDPKISTVQALAVVFKVPVGYLVGDNGDYTRLTQDLRLLGALKRGEIRLADAGDTQLDGLTVRLAALDGQRLEAVAGLVADPVVLDVLADADARAILAVVSEAAAGQRQPLAMALARPGILDALADPEVQEVITVLADLSPASRDAVLAVCRQFLSVEHGSTA